jgi:chromosome partitioning protein
MGVWLYVWSYPCMGAWLLCRRGGHLEPWVTRKVFVVKRTRVVAITSGKGGVGKSTLATELAGVLTTTSPARSKASSSATASQGRGSAPKASSATASQGRGSAPKASSATGQFRVLIVDAEPQQNSSQVLAPDPYADGLAELLLAGGGVERVAALIQVSRIPGLDVLPAGLLDPATSWLSGQRASETLIRSRIIQPVVDVGVYDWIVIDTPPSMGELTVGCLVAAHGVVSPVRASDPNSLRGVTDVIGVLEDVAELGPGVFAGVVVVDVAPRPPALQRAMLTQVARERWKVLGSVTSGQVVPKAAAAGLLVEELVPGARQVDEYRTVGRNIAKAVR